MSIFRKIIINLLKNVTKLIQLKGVPKVLNKIRLLLFKNDEIYTAYNDIRLYIDPTVNFHCLNILNYGGFEAVKTFEIFLKKGDVYIDIGTNFGYMALNAYKIVGVSGKVFCFEPDTKILPILKKNILLNNSNIKLMEKAVSDKKGIEIFNIATESGLSRLDNLQRNLLGLELENRISIECNTLDNYLENELITKVNFIKIDVEGHELRILKGAASTINKYKPTLFLEINHTALKQNDTSYLNIFDFLDQYGYQYYYINSHSADWLRLGREPTYHKINREQTEYSKRPFDVLCVNNEMEQILK